MNPILFVYPEILVPSKFPQHNLTQGLTTVDLEQYKANPSPTYTNYAYVQYSLIDAFKEWGYKIVVFDAWETGAKVAPLKLLSDIEFTSEPVYSSNKFEKMVNFYRDDSHQPFLTIWPKSRNLIEDSYDKYRKQGTLCSAVIVRNGYTGELSQQDIDFIRSFGVNAVKVRGAKANHA